MTVRFPDVYCGFLLKWTGHDTRFMQRGQASTGRQYAETWLPIRLGIIDLKEIYRDQLN